MDTLYLTKSNLKFNSVAKDRLFYDRFEYSVSFGLQEISCMREQDFDPAQISQMVARRREWREIAQQRWTAWNKKGGAKTILSHRYHKEISDQVEQDLHLLASVLRTCAVDFKLVVSTDYGWIYTNSVGLLNQLSQLPVLTDKVYSRAVINRPKNTLCLKNPRHNFRSYFNTTKLTANEKNILTNFLNNQKEHARISPALTEWCTNNFYRTQDYFFVDHNEMSWLTMLSLVRPGLIRKTMQIIQAK
jgi:hypothetical protein